MLKIWVYLNKNWFKSANIQPSRKKELQDAEQMKNLQAEGSKNKEVKPAPQKVAYSFANLLSFRGRLPH